MDREGPGRETGSFLFELKKGAYSYKLQVMKKLPAPHTVKLDALSEFAGGVAHDMNNILSLIEAEIATGARELEAGEITPAALQHRIHQLTQAGAQLTRQLLAFSQQKIGVEETLDLAELLHGMQEALQTLAGKDIVLQLDLQPATVIAAREHVAQVVLNLALNAVEAMPNGGILRISCAGGRLVVRDDGNGIAPHILPRIFQPFFTTKTTAGAGLGLSVVYGILEQLGAQITVESASRRGATCTVTFRTGDQPVEPLQSEVVYLPGSPPPAVGNDILRKILALAQEHHEKNNDDPDFQ